MSDVTEAIFQQHSLLTQAPHRFLTIWDFQSSHYWVEQFTEHSSAWEIPQIPLTTELRCSNSCSSRKEDHPSSRTSNMGR